MQLSNTVDMTLPDERYRAVVQTRRFLLDLCNPQHTPRIPKLIRDTARHSEIYAASLSLRLGHELCSRGSARGIPGTHGGSTPFRSCGIT